MSRKNRNRGIDGHGPTVVLWSLIAIGWLMSSGTIRAEESPKQILEASGVRGGLVVHVGCGDGKRTAMFHANDSIVVHGIDTDSAEVATARRHIASLDLEGKVSVERFDGERLPYVDNLVNLLVLDDPNRVPIGEMKRVLAPLGVAWIDGKKLVKPWPDAIDSWTHFLHGPDNNALADDTLVGPPRHMHWLAGPKWTRHHHADKGTDPTIRAVVSARGRLYYMVDETISSNRAVPSCWFLVARDAFSGVRLWKRRLETEQFERRLEQLWRTLLADDERVYVALGTDRPLSALHGSTGKPIIEYQGTEGSREMILDHNRLFVIDNEGQIRAFQADSAEQLWRWAPRDDDSIVPMTLAAAEGKVYVKTDRSVHCISASKGQTVWSVDLEPSKIPIRLRWPRERLIVKHGVVLCSYGGIDPKVLDRDKFIYLGSHPRVDDYDGKLSAMSTEDGRLLWKSTYNPGLESMPGEIYVTAGQVWLGPDFSQPRDLQTGVVLKTRPVLERLWTTGHHYRCYPGKATSRYLITAKRGVEMFDIVGENHSRNNWVRGTCRVGVSPCNGLLYAPPHSCGCYMEAKLHGFWALAAERSETARNAIAKIKPPIRLEKGPAYGMSGFSKTEITTSDWPTYRANSSRSGSTRLAVPTKLKQHWRAEIGGRLSPVTISDGRVLVARIDAHTVHALDASSGKRQWQFTAGARIDSPPTVHGGLVLFGSNDGWVYCLRATDGKLVWRFLAATRSVNTVAFEQVESVWPVHGSLLVKNDTVYVAAGRSSYLDGGISLYGLDPVSGEVRSTNRLKSKHTGSIDPPAEDERLKMTESISQNRTDYKTFLAADRSDAFSMQGALTDVMVADAESIYMRQLRFDAKLVERKQPRPHLFSTGSLLDGTEHNRSYWVLGTGDFRRTPVAYPWIVGKSLSVPYGLMLSYDETTVWGVRRTGVKGLKLGYALFATPRPDPSNPATRSPDFATRTGKKRTTGLTWSIALNAKPRAMIRAGDMLILGSRVVTTDSPSIGSLQIVSTTDGQSIGQIPLPSPPIWDGISAATSRLYLSHEDGSIVCLGSEK